ncbi:MAG TPA: DUF2442 domain-containing protein [Candidatus Cybelea sp.]|jgi:hypothetical protein|nr:DUF2442 domain-containing protein [Candidatus Cybelea sp.]
MGTKLMNNVKTKSAKAGDGTSKAEVLNVSPHGFWLLAAEREHFLGFEEFPWFREASVSQIFNVEFSHGHHFYWPELDVDLDLDRIEHPENFPLLARTKV